MRVAEPASAPVESKVKSATVGAAVAGLVLWVLNAYVYSGSTPDAIQALVDVVVPGAVAFVAGWLTRHTPRATGQAPPVA
jgi:hypothetical protein